MHQNNRLAEVNQSFHFGKSSNQQAGFPAEADGFGKAPLEQAFDPFDEVDARRRALEAARERSEMEERERVRLEALQPPPSSVEEAAPEAEAATPAAVSAEPQAQSDAAVQPATPEAKPAAARPPEKTGKPADTIRRPEIVSKRPARSLEVEPDSEEDTRTKKKGAKPAKGPVKGAEERRERIKLTINNAFDEAQRERSLASLRRRREREKLRQAGVVQQRDKVMREVIIPEVITIQELANRMTERAVDVIKLLMAQGAMHKINDVIDADTAELIVQEFGHTPKRVSEADGIVECTYRTRQSSADLIYSSSLYSSSWRS